MEWIDDAMAQIEIVARQSPDDPQPGIELEVGSLSE